MDGLYNEIFDACNKTFGNKVSFRLKKELTESIELIFQNYLDDISNQTSNSNSNINVFIIPNFPMFSTIPNMNSTYFPNPYYMSMLPFQPQITPILPQTGFTPIQPTNMFNMLNMFPFYNQPLQKPTKSKKKIHKTKILPKSAKITAKPPILSEQKFSDPNISDQADSPTARPANAFILYSKAMREEARQQNPSLSNTEVSRILGKMWKEVPEETKRQYKEKAQRMQEEFRRNHPDYTYRQARRKKTLSDLLTKSTQGIGQGFSNFNTEQRSQNEQETEKSNFSNSPKPSLFGQNNFSNSPKPSSFGQNIFSNSPKPSSFGQNNFSNSSQQDVTDQTDSPAARPVNAFILYSQAMREEVRQQNPSLSNTEVSRILGNMWKEVPEETKKQYKEKAQRMQEEFRRNHPDYTYRQARRKKTLSELLTKSTQGIGQGFSNFNKE